MLLAWLQAESTRHRKIALQLPRDATLESKIRTVARVFHVAPLTPQDVTDVLLRLRPDGPLTLILDRTFVGRTACRRERAPVWGYSSPSGRVPAWHDGQTPPHILMLGARPGGAVIPLVWSILPHQGNSGPAAHLTGDHAQKNSPSES